MNQQQSIKDKSEMALHLHFAGKEDNLKSYLSNGANTSKNHSERILAINKSEILILNYLFN